MAQTWDVFLSHAGTDRTIAEQFLAALERRGCRVFASFRTEIDLGQDLREALPREIQQSLFVVALIGIDYLERRWTMAELDEARRIRWGRLLPVLLPSTAPRLPLDRSSWP